MIKVLIVDDEILIRVGIKSCIDWESNGFEIIGLAEDGQQALELIEKKKPQIVLTDIKMPHMDGLELTEKIKGQYPQIRVIVLSCYNEFDFIKRAMKLGADDYILKLSMQPESLLKVLNQAKIEIDSSEQERLQSGKHQRDMKINKSFLKEDLYKRAIDDAISGESLVKELKKLGSEMSFTQSGVICAQIDDYSHASTRSRLEDQYLLKISVTNIMEEIISSFCKGEIVEIGKGEFLIIIDYFGKIENYNRVIEEFCRSVNNALKNYLNITVSFGISKLWKNADNFKIKYTQATRALEQKFYYGRASILFYDKKLELSDKLVLLNFDDEKTLVKFLENLNDEGAKGIIEKYFANIHTLQESQPSKVRMAAVEVLHSFIKVAKKFEVEDELGRITTENGENPVDMLMKSETILDISGWFTCIVKRFVDCLSNKRLSVERPEILKLKQYISDNIYEDITLEKATKITNMSKGYLSSIFKKETGESFTDYVNRLKMEEAKELIQRYGLKTYEVAEKMGFHDESYFSKLFKKYLGINPSKVGYCRALKK